MGYHILSGLVTRFFSLKLLRDETGDIQIWVTFSQLLLYRQGWRYPAVVRASAPGGSP